MNKLKGTPVKLNHTQLYWVFQVLGWSSIVFVETINYTFFIVGEFMWGFFLQFCVMAGLGILISHFYRKWFIPKTIFEKDLSRIWIKGVFDVLVISLLMTFFLYVPMTVFTNPDDFSKREFWISFFGQVMNLGRYVMGWVVIYYLYHIMKQNQHVKEQKLILENAAKSAELELLKNQLNPHFLFNSLNSIKALVLIDQEKARDGIIKLSELLRFSLNYERVTLIAIQDEMNEVQKYLELEKIRFGDRLELEIQLEEDTMELKIPPAMVLTLAENAIKHGISQVPDGGKVRVVCQKRKGNLRIMVTNPGSLDGKQSLGIGLKNVTKRLQALYGNEASFELVRNAKEEIEARILIPNI